MVELFDTYGVLHIGPSSFLFDLDDLPVIESRSWYVDKDGYLTSSYYYCGALRIIRFHRIVAHPQPGQRVDHKNKNRADNRKQNLRCCSFSENNHNRGLYSTNTSGVKRTYIVAYYYDRLTMEEIAEKFAVNKSTVCRTISRAKKRLERVLRYASPSLLDKRCYMSIRTSNNKRKRPKGEGKCIGSAI